MDLTVLRSFAGSHTPGDARTAAVKTALQSPTGGMLREELGSWVIQLLPPESVVPEIYAEWRPLVRDAMLFMIAHLSAARLAPKLVEQIDLPLDIGAQIGRSIGVLPSQPVPLERLATVLA